MLRAAAFSGAPVVRVGRGHPEGFADPDPLVTIAGMNLTATKARLLLMACLMKFGSLPAAADPERPDRRRKGRAGGGRRRLSGGVRHALSSTRATTGGWRQDMLRLHGVVGHEKDAAYHDASARARASGMARMSFRAAGRGRAEALPARHRPGHGLRRQPRSRRGPERRRRCCTSTTAARSSRASAQQRSGGLRPRTAAAALKLGWNAGNLHWRVRFEGDVSRRSCSTARRRLSRAHRASAGRGRHRGCRRCLTPRPPWRSCNMATAPSRRRLCLLLGRRGPGGRRAAVNDAQDARRHRQGASRPAAGTRMDRPLLGARLSAPRSWTPSRRSTVCAEAADAVAPKCATGRGAPGARCSASRRASAARCRSPIARLLADDARLGHLPRVQAVAYRDAGLELASAELVSGWTLVNGLVSAAARLGVDRPCRGAATSLAPARGVARGASAEPCRPDACPPASRR